ncbi:hypothetical protein BaRGS_00023236 [Batillaria attramentaria]|uniref:DDE Tnp4 domain-containing protein n=1 Tax=Batillaria attramentaria TaxID=370345 RepID=A0ABD0KEK9_9CAEN
MEEPTARQITLMPTAAAEEERMMRDELNRLTVENLELKEKLAQKEMTLESLKDSDDTVRGFDIPELAAMVGAEVKIPAFTRGKCQMTAHEIESTRKLAHVRIHVERVIGMLCGKYTILNGDLPVELLFVREGEELTTLDKVVTVCCSQSVTGQPV